MATDGGGGEVDGRQRRLRAQFWSLVQIPTRIQFCFANFHVTDILESLHKENLIYDFKTVTLERAVVEERWGKANPSFWGQSSWEGGE